MTAGEQRIRTYQKTSFSQRQFCSRCGGHLMTRHPLLKLIEVFAAMLPTLEFRPGMHINYARSVLPMRDGLPKLRNFPVEFGGTGELMRD